MKTLKQTVSKMKAEIALMMTILGIVLTVETA